MTRNTLTTYRPNLHFAPKKNWLNDPNGLVYFKGEYHLFFQHNPNDTVWGPMHWGHAVSKDLVEWEELDIALYPDEHGTIFSGSAVIDWNNTSGFFPDEPGMVAIFTHHLDGTENTDPVQTQSLAYSHDQGRTWIKYEGNPVLTHPTKVDFRDPKVFWHKDTKKWVMSLATGQTVSFYSSPNLIDWQFESEFGENFGSHDGVWECPDLFELKVDDSDEKHWVLIVSIGDNINYEYGSRTQYFIGSFDGTTFTPYDNQIRWLDYGKDNYAGVSFSDIPEQDGRRIYLGWMNNWRYADKIPTGDWRGLMTLPRSLTLNNVNDKLQVVQRPVKELNQYFTEKIAINDEEIKGGTAKDFVVSKPTFKVDLAINNRNSQEFGVKLYHSETNYTTININSTTNEIVLSRKNSGKTSFSDNFKHDQKMEVDHTDELKLQIIVDSCSIEVFVNDGSYALTSLIFPEDQKNQQVSIFSSDGGDITISNGSISEIK